MKWLRYKLAASIMDNGYVAIDEASNKAIVDKSLVLNNAYALLMALKNKAEE